MSGIKEELHLTHGSDARSLCEELDYVDMLALSGLFRQWALYEKRFTPEQRTALIAWSADLEDWRDGPAKGGVPPIHRWSYPSWLFSRDGCINRFIRNGAPAPHPS